MDRKEKKLQKQQERVRKADIIKHYQDEVNKVKSIIDNDKNLSQREKERLKSQIKQYKGLIFATKHPYLDSARDLFSEFFSGMGSLSDALYDHNYGGEGYTESDKAEVRDAMNYFRPVAADRARARIEDRIKEEKQPGNEN